MERFICDNVYVPLRSGPTHKSEMLSQILFGERYTITDSSGSWTKIRNEFDNFCGWIDSGHIRHLPDDSDSCGHVLNRTLVCHKEDKTRLVLEPGCEIFNPDFEEKTFTAGKTIFRASQEFNMKFIATDDKLQDIAMRFINSPYIWGGRVPSGIDCSGLTQLAFKIAGIKIPRDAADQACEGTLVSFLEEALAGDLVFFGDDRITHVGMLISRGLVIHASGRVRIDQIDHQGIFKREINGYSHTLRTIRRIPAVRQER